MRKLLSLLIIMIFSCPTVFGQITGDKQLKPLMPKVNIDGKFESQQVVPELEKKVNVKTSVDKKAEDKTVKLNDNNKKGKNFLFFWAKDDKAEKEPQETVENKLNAPVQEKQVSETAIKIEEKDPDKQNINNEKPAIAEETDEKSAEIPVQVDNKADVKPDQPVNKVEKKPEKMTVKKTLTYSDLDIQRIANEIKGELAEEETVILGDLRILWQAAVEKSDTIRFAILKLSNPDGEEEKRNIVKKILTPLTSVAPLVGVGSGDPIAGGGAIIGGGLLSSLLADDTFVNKHLSRITDVDLVVMAQEIDNLQQKLVILYYNYLGSVERLKMADEIVNNRYKYYEAAYSLPPEVLSVADVFYRESIDMQYKARQEVLAARSTLEQLVGNDALIQVDKNIHDRLY